MSNYEPKRTIQPTNQKAIYHSFTDVFAKLMNGEISVDLGEKAVAALAGANRTFALSLKEAEVEKRATARKVESTSFADTTTQLFTTE